MANTIADKLTYLEETKGLIKQAIIAKGGTVSDEDTFRSYADKIEAIQSGGGGGTVNLPDGTKFGYSTFTTVPDSIIPYLETQTDMYQMFYNCELLETVSQINTHNVTNMNQMFYYCKKLQTIPLFDTANVNDMGGMFLSCTSLTTVPQFDTNKVTSMSSMFNGCTSLQTVPLFDTTNVNDMHNMFVACTSLTTVPQFNTVNVTNMGAMFSICSSLKTIPLLDTTNVTNMNQMFYDCSSLINLGGFTGLKVDLELAYCPKLTVESVMNVINNAADMTSEPKTLTLSQDTFDKLSQEQIATASAKGWNIAAA